MSRVIPKFIYRISNHQPITIYGREKVLDFTYIDDCVDGLCRGIDLLVSGREANQTINLAFGEGHNLEALATYIGEALDKRPTMILEPPRLGEVTHYIANISRARALLGYNPTNPLREGIRKAVTWSVDWWNNHPTTIPL